MSAASRRTGTALIRRGHWLTLPDCKQVLVVAHTMTYAQRLREVCALLESDLRIQVAFTIAPHVFGDGVSRLLQDLRTAVLPWEEAVRTEFDLALAAGSRGIEQVRAPLVRLSHGAGHIKLLRETESPEAADPIRPPGMLSRRYLVRDGRVVPAAIALGHEQDREQLAQSCPEALPVAAVVGDPCYDRIAASLPHRAEYRRALGLGDRQGLVVVASTWGRSSSFGHFDALLPRLLSELPRDGYRTALLVHPNVWAGHSSWQMQAWLAALRRRGVAVVPPEADWQTLLIAADWVIGDHGSVTSYATLAGAPILLARSPDREVHPASPAAALALTAPALSPLHPLEEQLRYAAAEYRSEEHARVAGLISSEPGRFHRNMRALLYRLLRLGQPAYLPAAGQLPAPPPLSSWTGEAVA
ncbi:hypothetical protein [Streptomyces sp. XD-27]|uniref:hypothetical protein n=1 Tax=Streptomyces sp. XD-27 TaxID=3062779 RepID=UPI0026F43016|nr:hypothetical protein [Streptomyces sp. XD-27]WKX68795.1 hypothetical protein Q3Y56_01625 [Streptomyces sp. XD-27]